ncbi:hypothetical protein B0H19DRAFT_296047 [Mycena capillaripes]|nr:hypothetical protein B0H19DRAFT_296047 [Mycena capillaripes]
MSMFKKEAFWISFGGSGRNAIKVSVGGVNAISGSVNKSITPLTAEQDYLVSWRQRRLDGIVTGPGVVRQFVATAVGHGYTIEEQVTGKADEGGLQFDIFSERARGGLFSNKSTSGYVDPLKTPQELGLPLQAELSFKSSRLGNIKAGWTAGTVIDCTYDSLSNYYLPLWQPCAKMGVAAAGQIAQRIQTVDSSELLLSEMGVLAGGKIFQRITGDTGNPRNYDEEHGHRLYIHIVSPEMWEDMTGVPPPITPITREVYRQHNMPWSPSYEEVETHVENVSNVLAKVKSVAQLDEERTGIVGSMFELSTSARRQEVINFALDRVAPLHIGTPSPAPVDNDRRAETKRRRSPLNDTSEAEKSTKLPKIE